MPKMPNKNKNKMPKMPNKTKTKMPVNAVFFSSRKLINLKNNKKIKNSKIEKINLLVAHIANKKNLQLLVLFLLGDR